VKGTNKTKEHTENQLKHLDTNRGLSQSEENKNLCEHTVPSLLCVHIHSFSLLIEKDLYECRNISVKLPCVCVCL
jgi:hypothetical protein